jgi:transaldolase
MSPLTRLATLGTSVWVDGLVPPAELERLVREDSVTGLTSNPPIFRAAVLDGDRYAERIAARDGAPPQTLYEALALEDVQAAADVLAPVFARTGGADGFVSLEVAPDLAHDADATVAAARDLWGRVHRPNAMIKIPATPAGVDADPPRDRGRHSTSTSRSSSGSRPTGRSWTPTSPGWRNAPRAAGP